MIKYIVYSRPIPGKNKTTGPSIVEVDAVNITRAEDTSVGWMPAGEYKARLVLPNWLHEIRDGSTEKVDPIYYNFALFFSVNEAKLAAAKMIRVEFEFNLRKYGVKFTEEDIRAKFEEIEEVLL